MRIFFSIDPSINNVGVAIWYGVTLYVRTIKTKATNTVEEKLAHIFTELRNISDLYQPEFLVIERPWGGRNSGTVIKLSLAAGVAVAAVAAGTRCKNFHYRFVTPSEWKHNEPKKITRRKCESLYHGEYNEHEVDAIMLGEYHARNNQEVGIKPKRVRKTKGS